MLCCSGPSLYTWSDEWIGDGGSEEEMAECIGVPASLYTPCNSRFIFLTIPPSAEKFDTRDLKWAPDGKGIVLLDKDTFCCAFEVEDGGDAEIHR